MRTISVTIPTDHQWPSEEEMHGRNAAIADLEVARIGRCVESGGGYGVMEFVLDVEGEEEDVDRARAAIAEVVAARFPGRSVRVHVEEPVDVAEAREEREFYDSLGPEREGPQCRHVGCARGAVAMSALCRRHHFEQVQGHACPFDD